MEHRALYRQVVSEYRDAHGERYARWIARQIALVGTPF